MRFAVCLVVAAALTAGCGALPKTRAKGTAPPRVTSAGRPGPTSAAPPSIPSTPVSPAANPAPRPVAPATPPPAATTSGAEAELDPLIYRLAPGDGVHIDVFNEPELTVNAGIGGDGMISYPLIGHLQAAGLTVRELEDRLVQELKRGYLVQPSVRVSIEHFRPIFIMGSVRRVGPRPFVPGLTVDKALATAGGMTQYASTKKIYIQHWGMNEDQKEKVDLDAPVRPGDTIIVEERLF